MGRVGGRDGMGRVGGERGSWVVRGGFGGVMGWG
jgi:hypothetical protein